MKPEIIAFSVMILLFAAVTGIFMAKQKTINNDRDEINKLASELCGTKGGAWIVVENNRANCFDKDMKQLFDIPTSLIAHMSKR